MSHINSRIIENTLIKLLYVSEEKSQRATYNEIEKRLIPLYLPHHEKFEMSQNEAHTLSLS